MAKSELQDLFLYAGWPVAKRMDNRHHDGQQWQKRGESGNVQRSKATDTRRNDVDEPDGGQA